MSHIQNTALEVATAAVHPLSHLDNTRLKQSLLGQMTEFCVHLSTVDVGKIYMYSYTFPSIE